LVHKAQNRNVLLLAGKACNKLPAGPTVIKTVIFLQGCRARLHGKGSICAVWLPATAADCGARTFHKHGEIRAQFGDLPLQFSILPLQFGILPVQFGILPLQFGILPLQFGILPQQFGILPLQFGILPLQFGILPLQFD
jgi:hypothetical protein